MCTLNFLPQKNGYLAGMNRDELKTRGLASAPMVHCLSHGSAVYPQEAGGGTWIAANSRGNMLALLNWNAPADMKPPTKVRSRGEIIPALVSVGNFAETERALKASDLRGTLPFRLVGVFPSEREIRQWSWDGTLLGARRHEWVRAHWFSSSRSDDRAEENRGKVCESAWRETFTDRVGWLRALHASHVPEMGAFSICVHREDATTVSYTEVECGGPELRMAYLAGNPCQADGALTSQTIALTATSVCAAHPDSIA